MALRCRGAGAVHPITSGRARVNIHGALNLETFDTPFVAPITVDGVSAVQLLAKIEAAIKITVCAVSVPLI